MTPKIADRALCVYTYHENDDIHEFRYLRPTREAWDDLLAMMSELVEQGKYSPMIRTVIDGTAGDVPLAYAARASKAWTEAHPKRQPSRTVMLYRESTLLRIAEAMTNAMRLANDDIRFFHVSKRDEAIAWLLAD